MPKQHWHFPIPRLWIFLFSGWSFLVLFLIFSGLKVNPSVHHPIRTVLILAPLAIPLFFFALHRIAIFAESRGWIYYRQPKTSGMGAGMVLDLDILLARPKSQVENVRQARESITEGAQQDSAGDIPHEKKSIPNS